MYKIRNVISSLYDHLVIVRTEENLIGFWNCLIPGRILPSLCPK